MISFQAPEDLVWAGLGPITVEFEDGSVHVVTLDPAGSTSGPVASGAEIRMVLTGLPDASNASTVRVHMAGQRVIQLNLQK